MFDLHYDLLSILYYCYILNDFSYIDKIKANFNEQNVNGIVANLYFMSQAEMEKEIGIKEIDVCEMFKVSVQLFKKYFPNLKAIFSIEGCDYIKDTQELEQLKNMGLGSILLVWNNENKYGSGIRSHKGLTKEGEVFLKKAIDLGLIIDLSHMNTETFWDSINLIKNYNKKAKIIVSHSNSFDLCNNPRNITDEQIKALKDVDALVGLVTYNNFISSEKLSKEEIKDKYLEHIKRVVNILGIEKVGVSTDDMSYEKYLFNVSGKENIISYCSIKKDLSKLLGKIYNKNDIDKILNQNVMRHLFN